MSYTYTYNNTVLGKSDVIEFLKRCGLDQYVAVFIDEGFDTMSAVHEITEEDFIALNVKRGHRRLIQREIATLVGIPKDQPISIKNNPCMPLPVGTFCYQSVAPIKKPGEESSSGYVSMQSSSSTSSPFASNLCSSEMRDMNGKMLFDEEDEQNSDYSTKLGYTRKYKRHPKPDLNAPVKPPSAYVAFSNAARAQLKDRNLSFSDLAKIVGDRWKNLNLQEKQQYEFNAMKAKDDYVEILVKYKQTQEYKDYQAYLEDFKSKQQEENKQIMRERKRLKRDSSTSSRASSGNRADCSSNGNNSNSSNETYLSMSTSYYNDRPARLTSTSSTDNSSGCCDF